jgi:transposase InsO family protein
MDSTRTKELVITALEQAVKRENPPNGVIHHSDCGSQYASHAYQKLMVKHGFVVSMSRKGQSSFHAYYQGGCLSRWMCSWWRTVAALNVGGQ